MCCVSWGHDQGDNQPPSWNLWGFLCSSSSALINSLCSSSWKLNCSVLPEIQYSAESFSIAFHWQRRTRFFREMHACCSSREHAEHAGLIKSLWEGISMLTQVLQLSEQALQPYHATLSLPLFPATALAANINFLPSPLQQIWNNPLIISSFWVKVALCKPLFIKYGTNI